jgi:ribosomal protein S9
VVDYPVKLVLFVMGFSRALDNFDPNFHAELKANSLLTRDSRVVERRNMVNMVL